jgi:catechol 2,3-dioxygenase-like lactoylglutathione lyase family enzyme
MGMDHVGFVVPDAQLAADFLIDVFDAEFDWEVKREPRTATNGRRARLVADIWCASRFIYATHHHVKVRRSAHDPIY